MSKSVGESRSPPDGSSAWLGAESITSVHVTSEHPAHPVEGAILGGSGWRAGAPGAEAPRGGRPPDILNVYDVEGRLVATRPRGPARPAARQARAVSILLADGQARVLLSRRLEDAGPAGSWDRTASGDVGADHTFDTAALRLAGAALFGDPESPDVALIDRSLVLRAREAALSGRVLLHSAGVQLDTREHRGGNGESIFVAHEVALYLGRTGVPREGCSSSPSREAVGLHAFEAIEVDRLLVDGLLAPVMASLWLARGWELLAIAGGARSARGVR